MRVFRINNTQQNNINIQFKQKVTPKQMLLLIDSNRLMEPIELETRLSPKEINEFCLKNFGKTYVDLKRERYNELLKIVNSSVAKKICLYKLFPQKFRFNGEISKLASHKEKDAIRLWENGVSVEEIAKAIRASKEEVYEFLANVAREKCPIVG